MLDDPDIKERIEHWQTSKSEHADSRAELVAFLLLKLHLKEYNLTELAEITGIKRTTLHYMIYGKEGKSGQDTAA